MGRQPRSEPEKTLGQNVVIQLTSPLKVSGRNVSMHNYFNGVPLAKTMLQRKLTVIGTTKKCKREIPECMKPAKSRETKTPSKNLWFQRPTHNGQLRSPKKQNCDTVKYDASRISIDEEDHQKRPEIIKFYNKTKIGVDLVDQMVGTYNCRKQPRRWPLKLSFNLLDVSALNTYTI